MESVNLKLSKLHDQNIQMLHYLQILLLLAGKKTFNFIRLIEHNLIDIFVCFSYWLISWHLINYNMLLNKYFQKRKYPITRKYSDHTRRDGTLDSKLHWYPKF